MKPKKLERLESSINPYTFSMAIMGVCMRFAWRGRLLIKGLENIPTHGSAVLAMNQTTHLDPLFFAIAIPRPIHFVGLDDGGELEPWYTPLLYRKMGVIARPHNLLKDGGGRQFARWLDDAVCYRELIGIFPEERLERKQDRTTIISFRKGVVTIARHYRIPVIPILMRGTEKVIPNSTAKLREPIHIRSVRIVIGSPIPWYHAKDAEYVRNALTELENVPIAPTLHIAEVLVR